MIVQYFQYSNEKFVKSKENVSILLEYFSEVLLHSLLLLDFVNQNAQELAVKGWLVRF